MKRITLIAVALLSAGIVSAQTPEKKAAALVTKQTSLGCFYCGDWGWTLGHQLFDDLKASGKGVYMAVYDLDQGGYGATDNFTNPTGTAIEGSVLYDDKPGNPTFKINGKGSGTGQYPTWYSDRNQINSVVGQFASVDPVASSAVNFSITGNKVTATAKSKFWAAGNGEYYMACYLLEDDVMNVQNGQSGQVSHNAILRGSMTAASAWGEQIGNGAVAVNTESTKSYTIDIAANWQKPKLRVISVIWKKTGANKYEVVNSVLGKTGSTAIKDITHLKDISLSPNPSKDFVTVSFSALKASTLDIRVTDALGRAVYNNTMKASEGANQFTVNTSELASGVYNMTLSSEDGVVTKRLSVIQ